MFRTFGYDLTRYEPNRHPTARLMRLMEAAGIDLVLDIGANRGQYALELRENGYAGRIISFEPLGDAYQALAAAAGADKLWMAEHMALGAAPGTSVINVAGNSTSSSLLDMLPAHQDAAPTSRYVKTEEITVETVDRILPKHIHEGAEVWMKVDTQGYEVEVLKGATASLPRIRCIQLEMSLTPLYEGSEPFHTLLSRMLEDGFDLVGLQPGFTDNRTGRLLQVDGIFQARDQKASPS